MPIRSKIQLVRLVVNSLRMPTVLREGPCRFFFYASDRYEAPHVHVERDDKVAKFWLRPVGLERSGGASIGDQAIGAVVVTAFR